MDISDNIGNNIQHICDTSMNIFINNFQEIINTHVRPLDIEYNINKPRYSHIPYGFQPLIDKINVLNKVYTTSLDENSLKAKQPDQITVKLKAHQLAMLNAMKEKEENCLNGLKISDEEMFYSRFGVLGDNVGSGKSLVVLAHIANTKNNYIDNLTYFHKETTPLLYSTYTKSYKDISMANLLLVPHFLYKQWEQYCKEYTTLNVCYCKNKSFFNKGNPKDNIVNSDIVLCSNTLYKELSVYVYDNKIKWNRAYIDEADNIHLSSTNIKINAQFTWFITATWYSLMIDSIYASKRTLQLLIAYINEYKNNRRINEYSDQTLLNETRVEYFKQMLHPDLVNILLKDELIRIESNWASCKYFRDFINNNYLHHNIIIRCTNSFREQSILLPSMSDERIICEPTNDYKIINSHVSQQIRNMLNAGDIDGAMNSLGIHSHEQTSLIDAVTKSHSKDLERLEATYEFKRQLEYATPHAKEEALKSLENKIKTLRDSIQILKDRISNPNLQECAICYSEIEEPLITPCCNQIFCASCILTSLTHIPSCPLCRSVINANNLKSINSGKKLQKSLPERLTKQKALINVLKNNPNGKFLIFSHYENPFIFIENEIKQLGINVGQIKGNKYAIDNMIKKFTNGDISVLLINSNSTSTGLNLDSATHIIFYHGNMDIQEEHQIIGRANRLGRTTSLNIIRLLYPTEAINK
jgi:hypothetical protein